MAVNLVSVATINRKPLYQGQPGAAFSTVYTAPASTDVKVGPIIMCNTTAIIATVTIAVVPSGGTAGATNAIISAMAVPANGVAVFDSPVFMTASDFIAALQGTASAVTVTIGGETYA